MLQIDSPNFGGDPLIATNKCPDIVKYKKPEAALRSNYNGIYGRSIFRNTECRLDVRNFPMIHIRAPNFCGTLPLRPIYVAIISNVMNQAADAHENLNGFQNPNFLNFLCESGTHPTFRCSKLIVLISAEILLLLRINVLIL